MGLLQLYQIHGFRNAETMHSLAREMKQMAKLRVREGEQLLHLTERTTRDAATMRTVSKSTFFYLPATFTAVRTHRFYLFVKVSRTLQNFAPLKSIISRTVCANSRNGFPETDIHLLVTR